MKARAFTTFALDLDDRAVSVARGGRVLASSPSVVFDPSGKGGWYAVRSHPTAISSRHLCTVLTQQDIPDRTFAVLTADLRGRLEANPPMESERMWVAAPAVAGARGLGSVLGVLRNLSLPVGGFIDAATAAAAALNLERSAIVLECGLHHVAATAVDVGDGLARRRRSVVSGRAGLIGLYESLLQLVRATMVRRTRFDPLHDAATEQRLFDMLPCLISAANTAGETKVALGRRDNSFEIELSRDQLALAAQPMCREVLRLIHELRPAGMPIALALPRTLLTVPGLRDGLEQFAGCDLVSLDDGFAAAAISAGDTPEWANGGPVRLLRRAPLATFERLAPLFSKERLSGRKTGSPVPTHVVLDGQAFQIGEGGLVVGRTPGAERSIPLADGLPGVSRRHCTFIRDGEELVLLDHSSFGTVVNAERITKRVRVYAGDRVQIGRPGVELTLIAIDAPGTSLVDRTGGT